MLKQKAKRWVNVALCLFFFALFSPLATAQSIYTTLDTPFYDASSSGASINCSLGGISSSTDLAADVRAAIEKLKPDYVSAADKTGVPWQLLASIHYRENTNNPNGDLQAGNPIGGPYGQSSTAYDKYGYPSSIANSAEIAAKMLVDISKKPINVPNPDPEAIKDVLYSYNGRADAYAKQAETLGFNPATQPYEGSPYVMNNFDAKHQNMKMISHDFGPVDAVDTRPGAFTVYSRLGGTSGASIETCNSGGAVAGDAVQTAINFAWPDHHNPNYFDMKPAYKAAVEAAAARREYVGGGAYPGIDCGGFITRVMRDSGADPNYNQANGPTTAQQAYMDGHPEKYQHLTNISGTVDLKPGDIAINSDHTYIYVGSQPGFNGNSASSSFSTTGSSWRSPMADNAYDFSGFSWYRLIK